MSTTHHLRHTTPPASPNSNANSSANSSRVCGGSGLSNAVKTAVVTTVRRPTKGMWNDFVCYHLSLRVDHIFVFFDDARDAQAIESTNSLPPSSVTTCVQGPALRFILYACFTHAFGNVTHALRMLYSGFTQVLTSGWRGEEHSPGLHLALLLTRRSWHVQVATAHFRNMYSLNRE